MCINLYPEIIDSIDPNAANTVSALYSVPGLKLLKTLPTQPFRGSVLVTPGLLYVVSGNTLYSIDTSFNYTTIGTISSSSGLVSMIENGLQVSIFDGQNGYCYTIAYNTLIPLSLPFSYPSIAVYTDGFGLVNQAGSNTFWQSNFKDFTIWNALNFGQADASPDPVIGMGMNHRQVWLFGSDSTEVWSNAGTPGLAFQRLQGVYLEAGCIAPNSVARCGESLAWLGSNNTGGYQVFLSRDYRYDIISTDAISYFIEQFETVSDAFGYSYWQGGQLFYSISFPSGNKTFTYSLKTKLWHERALFSNGSFSMHPAVNPVLYNNTLVVGDYNSGNLYAYDLDTYTNNSLPLKWLRTFRALPTNAKTNKPLTFSSLDIEMETGITIPQSGNPQMILRVTDDAYNWSSERYTAMGKTGETSKRVRFTRLGSTRLNNGTDRIFEISSDANMRMSLAGANTEIS